MLDLLKDVADADIDTNINKKIEINNV